MIGEADFSLKNYLYSRGPCAGEVRGGFVTWGLGYPGATLGTTAGVFDSDMLLTGNRGLNEFETFRSQHIAGAQFTLADGSVRFVSAGVDAGLFNAAATRNRGDAAELP